MAEPLSPEPAAPALTLLDALPDPCLLVTPGGEWRVRDANPAAARFFGTGARALRGRALTELLPELGAALPDLAGLARGGAAYTAQVRASGPWAWVGVRAYPVGDLVAVQFFDVTAHRTAEDRGAALLDLTAALSRVLTAEEAAGVVLRRGLAALDGVAGSVYVLDERAGDLVLAGALGYDGVYMDRWRRFPLGAPTLLGDALRAGRPLFLSTAEVDARYPHLRVERTTPTRSVAALPLHFGGAPVGVLGLGFAGEGAPAVPDRPFLLALAEGLAQALERARLFAGERRARARSALLYEVTAAVGGATTPEGVARVVTASSTRAVGAAVGRVRGAGPGDLAVLGAVLGASGAPGDHEVLAEIEAECARGGEAVFLGAPEFGARFPGAGGPLRTAAALPLRAGDGVIGVLAYGWEEAASFGPAQRDLLGALAAQCAQALERTLLAGAERRARERAALLARAGEVLAAPRDPQGVLDALVDLAVPALAGACAVLLPGVGGRLVPHAPLPPEFAPVPVEGDHPAARVFRDGEGLLLPDLPTGSGPGGARALVAVPLTARGEVLGVLTLTSGTPGRFGDEDLALAGDLARRAAAALDNVRLYRAALTSEERYRALIEVTHQYVWTNSPEGEMRGEQPCWERLTGQTPGEYRGHGWATRLHPADREDALRAWQEALRAGTPYEAEQRVQVRDGSHRSFLVRAVPLRGGDGRLREWVGLHTDITELRRAERTLQAWGSELERQVEARTRELRAANEELGAFAHTVSHDLRAPVRHVAGFAALLRKKVADTPGALRYLDVIEGATRRMDTLIDALLGLARAGTTELHLEDVALGPLVEGVRRDLVPDLAGRRVSWRVGELPTVRADAGLLRLVLTNLLGNAVKYSRGREEAVVEVWAEEGTQEVTVGIRDNGVGFDPGHASRLFGVFQRLHGPEEFEGTGVGLANVKRIVEKHGGRVWAEARPGQGASFFFALPLLHPPGRPAQR